MNSPTTKQSWKNYAHLPLGIWLFLTPWYMTADNPSAVVWVGVAIALMLADFLVQIDLLSKLGVWATDQTQNLESPLGRGHAMQ